MKWKKVRLQNYTPWLQVCLGFIILLILAWYRQDPERVEKNYSRGIYPYISYVLRCISGLLPFSLGDVLYFVLGVRLIIKIIKVFRKIPTLNRLGNLVGKITYIIFIVIILFQVSWGLNYYRVGISKELQLENNSFDKEELVQLHELIISKANYYRRGIPLDYFDTLSTKLIYTRSVAAYKAIESDFPFLKYKQPSIKNSFYSTLGNWFGFLGYYNPFTGEAHLNITPPGFSVPFSTCHEIAHQLGYAGEDEANFIGYLAASRSGDAVLQYAAYFNLYLYSYREIHYLDSSLAEILSRKLDTAVTRDLNIYRQFIHENKSPLEPVFTLFYNRFLLANNQPEGIASYNHVITWLIAWYAVQGDI